MEGTSNYQIQLIDELTEIIDPCLIEFFELYKDAQGFDCQSIKGYVANIVNDMLSSDASPTYFMIIYKKLLASRRQQRTRWIRKIEANQEKYELNNSKSIFYFLYQQKFFVSMLYSSFQNLSLDNKTPEEAVDVILKNISEWRSNSGYYVQFILLPEIGNKPLEIFLKADIEFQILQHICLNFEGKINNMLYKKPYDIVTLNPFSSGHSTFEAEQENDTSIARIYSSDETNYNVSIVSTELRDTLSAFDQNDNEILGLLVNDSEIDIANGTVKEIHKTLISIANAVFNLSNTEKQMQIVERLKAMVQNTVHFKTNSYDKYFNILDSATVYKGGKEEGEVDMVRIVLGRTICDDILQQRLITVPTAKYWKLTNKAARDIYHRLQLDRISADAEKAGFIKQYKYQFFADFYLLASKRMKRNMEFIENVLMEFVDKQILLKDYEVKNDTYTLIFIPLSDVERNDLQFNKILPQIGKNPSN